MQCPPPADRGSVTRLPTDSPKLTSFLDQIEGHSSTLERIRPNNDSLLVVHRMDSDGPVMQGFPDFDPQMKNTFCVPADGWRQVDRRDLIHHKAGVGLRSRNLGRTRIVWQWTLTPVPIQYEQHPLPFP